MARLGRLPRQVIGLKMPRTKLSSVVFDYIEVLFSGRTAVSNLFFSRPYHLLLELFKSSTKPLLCPSLQTIVQECLFKLRPPRPRLKNLMLPYCRPSILLASCHKNSLKSIDFSRLPKRKDSSILTWAGRSPDRCLRTWKMYLLWWRTTSISRARPKWKTTDRAIRMGMLSCGKMRIYHMLWENKEVWECS